MKFHNKFQFELNDNLNELEINFKKLYVEHPELCFHLPHTSKASKEYLTRVCNESFLISIFDENLTEKNFFQETFDISLYRHLRYLPAYWHSHSFFEIACVVSGSCTNYIAEQTLHMTEGDVCIISPNTPHALSAFSDDCLVFNILLRSSTFEQTFFGILAENDILSDFFMHALYGSSSHPYLYFDTYKDNDMFNYIGYAYDEFHSNKLYKNRMINSVITAFFITLLRNHGTDIVIPDKNISTKNENTLFILKYMQEHFLTVTVPELANFFNYSERQIHRIIKSSTGMTFGENIKKLKMGKASHLLSHTAMSISDISDNLAYTDPANFRRSFKEYYGVTPSEFRNASTAE